MTQQNPYRLLGLPDQVREPSHYELLGLEIDQAEPQEVREAYERRYKQARKYRTGPLEDQAQRILDELREARSCLLDEVRKRHYDRKLRLYRGNNRRAADSTPANSTAASQSGDAPRRLAAAPVAPKVKSTAESSGSPTPAAGSPPEQPQEPADRNATEDDAPRPSKQASKRPRQAQTSTTVQLGWLALSIAVATVGVIGVLVILRHGQDSQPLAAPGTSESEAPAEAHFDGPSAIPLNADSSNSASPSTVANRANSRANARPPASPTKAAVPSGTVDVAAALPGTQVAWSGSLQRVMADAGLVHLEISGTNPSGEAVRFEAFVDDIEFLRELGDFVTASQRRDQGDAVTVTGVASDRQLASPVFSGTGAVPLVEIRSVRHHASGIQAVVGYKRSDLVDDMESRKLLKLRTADATTEVSGTLVQKWMYDGTGFLDVKLGGHSLCVELAPRHLAEYHRAAASDLLVLEVTNVRQYSNTAKRPFELPIYVAATVTNATREFASPSAPAAGEAAAQGSARKVLDDFRGKLPLSPLGTQFQWTVVFDSRPPGGQQIVVRAGSTLIPLSVLSNNQNGLLDALTPGEVLKCTVMIGSLRSGVRKGDSSNQLVLSQLERLSQPGVTTEFFPPPEVFSKPARVLDHVLGRSVRARMTRRGASAGGSAPVRVVAWCPDPDRDLLATGDQNGGLAIWNWQKTSGALINASSAGNEIARIHWSDRDPYVIAVSTNGKSMFYGTTWNGPLAGLADWRKGSNRMAFYSGNQLLLNDRQRRGVRTISAIPIAGRASDLVFADDAIAVAPQDQGGAFVQLYHVLRSGTLGFGTALASPGSAPVSRLEARELPNGALVLGASDTELLIWNVSDGRLIAKVGLNSRFASGGLKAANNIHWSANGRLLAISEPPRLRIVDVLAGKVHSFEVTGQTITSVAFDPNGGRLALGTQQGIALVAVDSAPWLIGLAGPTPSSPTCLSWHPSGRYLAAAMGPQVRIWHIR